MNLNDKLNSGTWRIIEIVIVIAGLIWAAAFLRSDVNTNTKWNERQDSQIETHKERARQTYVRKDIAQQRYENLIEKLDRLIDEGR